MSVLSEADLEDSIIGAPLLFGFPLILVCGRVEVKREVKKVVGVAVFLPLFLPSRP